MRLTSVLASFPLADLGVLFEDVERDVLHWVTCELYVPWLDPILLKAQEKVVAVPILVGALALLAFWRPRRSLRALLACALGFGLAMLLATILWTVIERPRPPHTYEEVLVGEAELATCASRPEALAVRKPISRSPSFPSRHALTAGVFATVVWLASRWMGVFAALYALLTIVGRVYGAKHWPSDVVVGLLLGIGLGYLSWRIVPPVLDRVGLGWLVRDPEPELPQDS